MEAPVCGRGRVFHCITAQCVQVPGTSLNHVQFTAFTRNEVLTVVRQELESQAEARGRRGSPRRPNMFRYRDMQFIDPALDSSRKPALLKRDGCMIAVMPPFRAVILEKKTFVLMDAGLDEELRPLLERIGEQRLRDGVLQSFADSALSALLNTAVNACAKEGAALQAKCAISLRPHTGGHAEVHFERLQYVVLMPCCHPVFTRAHSCCRSTFTRAGNWNAASRSWWQKRRAWCVQWKRITPTMRMMTVLVWIWILAI